MRTTLASALLCLALPAGLGAQRVVKGNLASTVYGVPQVAYELPLGPKRSLQFDVMISPWRSRDGAPQQFGIFIAEWRHHYHERGDGPYVGGHVGIAIFRLQRWDYKDTEFYQEGIGALGGVTVGYEKRLRDPWSLDLFAGGGTAQSKYKGYSFLTGDRYDGEDGWNESGEWLFYRGGLMLSYRLP